MSQHQPRGLPVPQRLSSISPSSNETRPHLSNIPPLSGLDRIIAQHSQDRRSYTANNNIVVDHDFLSKFGKTARTARQVEIPSPPLAAANRGGKGEAINGHLNLGAAERGAAPQRQLRPRASSPLLGLQYQTQHHDPLPSLHAKAHPTLHQPESSPTIRSSRDPLKHPSVAPQQAQARAQTVKHTQKQTSEALSSRDLAFRNKANPLNSSTESSLTNNLDPLQPYLQDQKKPSSSSSSSKPKHRPPMIDLSKLFPKPSDPSAHPAVPLLSPHRMTMSPSPVSLRSDASSFGVQQRKLGSIHQTVNKLTKPPSSKELSALRKHYEQKQQQQQQQHSEPSPYFSAEHHSHSFYEGQQQQQHSQSSQSSTPQYAQSSFQQQQVKKEKEHFFQRGKRERKLREEEQQRQKQQEEELRQRRKQEQKDRERKKREQLEREQQKKQEQVQQEKEQYFQRQKREKQRREEEKRRKDEPEQYQRRKKQEQKQRDEEPQQEQQQLKLQQQRQEELQSQHYQFPFHEKRTSYQRKPPVEWFDGPEGHISSDDDNAGGDEPTHYSIQNPPSVRQPAHRESAYSRGSSNRVSVHSNAMSGTSRASSRTLILSPAPEPAKKVTPEQSNTSPFISPASSRFHTFFHDWDLGNTTPPSVGSPSTALGGLSRKSSKITLNKSDLNESSVLCLSSSEDEVEDEEVEVHKPVQQRGIRDSIATFDEGASEIFTAKAVAASRGPSVSRVRNTSLPPPRISRDRSTSSNVRAPTYRPSNGIPTISEPDSPPAFRSSASASTISNPSSSPFDFQLPVCRTQNSIKSTNRRSRVMAVTRQEEQLLEVIRRHGGNMPPNFPLVDLPTPATSINNPIPNTTSSNMTRVSPKPPSPSTDCPPSGQLGGGSIVDTSFLALSPSLPPPRSKGLDGTFAGSDSSSHHALSASDSGGDHHSNPSPRASLVHSDTFPSPSTSWASPRTPTLGQYNQQQQKHYQQHNEQERGENPSPHSGSGGKPIHQHHVMLSHPQPLSSYPPTALPLSSSSPPSPLSSPPSPLPSATVAAAGGIPDLEADVVLPIEETKRHSRTRTDSSGAMVFGDGEQDDKSAAVDTTELPIWALGWSAETPGLAVVH